MDAQINFAGLCSFLNLDRGNSEMPEPSVILVRGDGESQAVTETQVSSKQQTPKADADQQPAGPTQSATLRGQWTVDAATPMTTLEINASVKISFAGAPPDGDSAAFDPKARRALRAGDSGEPLPDAPPAPPPEP
ncbi:MAG: hypothetical protein JWO56_2203, partial [Acidobacteria bacterium]|nr:hypothetical protein [Acidobacteriota bacterium]